MRGGKELIIIGDRVLISPDTTKSKTDSGLYLPQGVAEKEKVQSGFVVSVGPGYMIPNTESSEPWLNSNKEPQFVPLQVQEGDYAIFLRREAVEIEYESKKYMIVPQAGILAIVRDEMPPLDI